MHISFVHQLPSRTRLVGLKISSLKLQSRDKNIRLTHSHVLLLLSHRAGANTVQLSVSISTALKPKQQQRWRVLFMCSHSHADRFLHACPLDTDPLKMLQEKDSAPRGDSNGHKLCWHVGFIFKCRKEKTFTGIDSDADVWGWIFWEMFHKLTKTTASPFKCGFID